jgi:hypothetical protein
VHEFVWLSAADEEARKNDPPGVLRDAASTELTINRRDFLARAIGAYTFLATAGTVVVASGCDGSTPNACPPGRPVARVLSTKPGPTTDPLLWMSTGDLSSPGSWTTMSGADFLPGMGHIWDIDEIAVPVGSVDGCLESHVLFVGTSPPSSYDQLLLYQRQLMDGSWTPLFNLTPGIGGTTSPGTPYPFGRVSAARVGTELHVCGTASEMTSGDFGPGTLLHGIRPCDRVTDPGYEDRVWSGPWRDAGSLAGVAGPVVDVACAGVADPTTGREDLHVCAITNDGRLWHSVRNSETTTWTQFADAGLAAGNGGKFRRVDCAPLESQLHVVAVSSIQDGGKALYTIRNGIGSWRAFDDIVERATVGNGLPARQSLQPHNVSVAFCNSGLSAGQWRLYVLVGALYPEMLAYTIHSNEPVAWPGLPQGQRDTTWKPWSNLLDESGGGGSSGSSGFGNENTTFSVAEAELH